MATIKLNVTQKNYEQLIDFARNVVIHITGSAYYRDTMPSIGEVNNAIHALEYALASNKGATATGQSTVILRRKVLELQLSVLAEQIEKIAEGDPEKIRMSGMPVRVRQRNN